MWPWVVSVAIDYVLACFSNKILRREGVLLDTILATLIQRVISTTYEPQLTLHSHTKSHATVPNKGLLIKFVGLLMHGLRRFCH